MAREKRAEAAPTVAGQIREWMSYYRMFFIIIVSFNAVGIGFTLAHRWGQGRRSVATYALVNILVALLARNEIFLRVLYTVLLFLFQRWPPRWFRDAIATFLLHVGGFHSGFGISGTLWVVTATIEFFRQGPALMHPAVLAFSVVAGVLLLAVCASAMPMVRNNHHNVFENVHRLAGWTGLAILWILVCLANSWSVPEHRFIGSRITNDPDIYLALAVTICIFLPWTTVRKVPVKAEVLSSSVVALRFRDGYRSGLFGRISRHPLKENHAFGIASMSPSSGEHCMYVVGQGDFTRGLIADPPSHLWTRQYKFVGLPYMCSFYRSGLYVCTGSAIGVALSIFLQRDPRSRWHLLWVSSNIEKTYGTTALKDLRESYAVDEEKAAFEHAVTIWDTRQKGRPQLMKLIPELVERHNVEVVFATSNPQGTAEIVRGCAKRGIPCFGPVWDS
ncbi:hypothetical protein BS47DRAFT_1292070 [Hydnum rufescens UP504]|uniref:Non-ribosomal peptide synthetase n=1 Tax=Hydnum rufescens UP504 TaxID=1448309 RepID=A0A9P6DZ53_9AGAM|nr:hypothetical protein BS47DRAFT_1292070 [Hydnum rufescens UP504]